MYSHVQQTPYPLAQLPAFVPPAVEHSALKKDYIFYYLRNASFFQNTHAV
jgi:hypothetical protein